MTAPNVRPLLGEHPFFKGVQEKYLDAIADCASEATFESDSYICRAGDEANKFYLVHEGKIAVEIRHPTRQIVIQTVDGGDVLGWSWLFPPFRWHFDTRAMETTHALTLDGLALRRKIEADRPLGFELLSRFTSVMVERLEAMQLQLLDVYR